MRVERLADFLDLYKFSLGSIGYCVQQMRQTLSEIGNNEAVELADRAAQKHQAARAMEYDWEQQKKKDPLERKGTQEIDNRIDGTLSHILKTAEGYADLEVDRHKSQLADEFLEQLFPSGVYPITSKPFDDQHTTVNELIERLEGPFAEHVEAMSLGGLVEQLETYNERFGAELEPTRDSITYDEVQSAYTEAEDAFHQLVVQVMADYGGDTDQLNEVLSPLTEQTARTKRHLQSRGTMPEIDPETGEPVDAQGEDSEDSSPPSDDTTDETTDDTTTTSGGGDSN